MTLAVPLPSGFATWETGQPYSADPPSVSFTPGSESSKGDWYQLESGLSAEGFGLTVFWAYVWAGAQAHNFLAEIGMDPAGGTSYSVLVTDFILDKAYNHSYTPLGVINATYLPLRIPSGASLAMRAEDSYSSAPATGDAQCIVEQKRSAPQAERFGVHTESIGIAGSSKGTAITLGTSGSWGDWESLGATSKDLWYFDVRAGLDLDSINTRAVWVQLAVGDGSSYHVIRERSYRSTTWEEAASQYDRPVGNYPVKAGSTLYARGTTSVGSADSGWHVAAIGVGG